VDEFRARYLRDRVMTASPAQRVVMLYDRLLLDLRLAGADSAPDEATRSEHVSHALTVVAELYGSLDVSKGGPAENLASIYSYLLNELMAVRLSGATDRLAACERMIQGLRDAWSAAAEQLATEETAAPAAAAGGSRSLWG
jgi:flagellar secretion chaperone FliS